MAGYYACGAFIAVDFFVLLFSFHKILSVVANIVDPDQIRLCCVEVLRPSQPIRVM